MTNISPNSGDTASTSISPVIFSWLAKCRRSVISLRALLANCTRSKTRVTILMATVSPEISSEAELQSHVSVWIITRTLICLSLHHITICSRSHFAHQLPAFLHMKGLSKGGLQCVIASGSRFDRSTSNTVLGTLSYLFRNPLSEVGLEGLRTFERPRST